MRRALLVMTAIGLLLSCNHADPTKFSSDIPIDVKHIDTAPAKVQRQFLIEELKRLQAVFASKDEAQIANLFPLPLPDTTLGIYIDDSAYLEQFRNNNDQTTREMFIRFFPQIYRSLQMDELNQLFKHLKLDPFLQKDTVEQEVHIRSEPCYQFYSITVEQDLVTLSTGSGVNEAYQSSTSSEDDVQENSSEFCEHVLWWVFRFDGGRLFFIKQHGAG